LLVEVFDQHVLNLCTRLRPASYRPQDGQLSNFARFLKDFGGSRHDRGISRVAPGDVSALRGNFDIMLYQQGRYSERQKKHQSYESMDSL